MNENSATKANTGWQERAKQAAKDLEKKQQGLFSKQTSHNSISTAVLNSMLATVHREEESNIRKMPEHLFVGYFLPVFRTELPSEVAEARLQEWIFGAGGAMMAVDVIDKSGEVLFRVPSVSGTDHINAAGNREGKDSIASLLNNVSMLFNYSQAQGEAMIKSQMAKRLATLHNNNNPQWQGRREGWLEIFARYAGTEVSQTGVSSKTAAPTPPVGNADDFDDFEIDG